MHDPNMFGQQGMDQGPCTLTLWQVRAVCTQREPTGRVINVIVTEREKEEKRREERRRRERERERMKRTTEERKREGTREREREKRTPPFSPSLLPVWRFEMYPCVGSKRFRVYRQNARMFNMCAFCLYTRKSFEPAH